MSRQGGFDEEAESGGAARRARANANCVGERTVVLKQKSHGVISHAKSEANGRWEADLEELNRKIKIPAVVYAEAKPSTQATAGPIYKCLAAKSKTVEIAGG